LYSLDPLAVFVGISPFILSLLVLSIGTNLPEMFVGIHSVLNKQKSIALGDYIGSAAANTLLFGLMTIFSSPINLNGYNYFLTFGILLLGVILFYFFSRSKQEISRSKGFILLMLYIVFIVSELMVRK
jgi:cation:H+ antiporter